MRTVITALALALLATSASAQLPPVSTQPKGPDPRLATVRNAFIVPIDELAFDQPVARCLGDRIATETPIAKVATKDAADVILRISALDREAERFAEKMRDAQARLEALKPSTKSLAQQIEEAKMTEERAKQLLELHPTATILAELPDGTQLWKQSYLEAAKDPPDPNLACALAVDLLKTLRDAMKQARDAKNPPD